VGQVAVGSAERRVVPDKGQEPASGGVLALWQPNQADVYAGVGLADRTEDHARPCKPRLAFDGQRDPVSGRDKGEDRLLARAVTDEFASAPDGCGSICRDCRGSSHPRAKASISSTVH
jgi:hypothetical protein